ncbi:MAG: putative oxidoreductase C-terminal domain-containing protein [Gammaproteobacteria bacterium]
MKRVGLLIVAGLLLSAMQTACAWRSMKGGEPIRLLTLDPGHFHASLIQKQMYPNVDRVVHVYAPSGNDLDEHLSRVDAFNTRAVKPTRWQEEVYNAPDYLERMVSDRAGNLVVISGNNSRKSEYITRAIGAGMNVLADKPMVVTPADFQPLLAAFNAAAKKQVLLADIMTERFEIATVLQRELARQPALFGQLETGSFIKPAITMESVHYFSKTVAGKPLKRPEWFFDVRQQGEGLMDAGTHLVDLVQWEAFPDQALQLSDVQMQYARRWATPVTREQFRSVTGASDFPDSLLGDLKDGALQVFSNGEMTYQLRGAFARVAVSWEFEAPPGSGDTHYSLMRGTRANLVIRQGAAQKFKPVLYVERVPAVNEIDLEKNLRSAIANLQGKYPGIGLRSEEAAWVVTVPESYDVGHEAHFAQVTENFLGAVRSHTLPAWEVPNMLTKYFTLVRAYQMSHSQNVSSSTGGRWQREDNSLAWLSGTQTIWKLSYDSKIGHKPFFHPLSVPGGAPLTTASPADHPWHYGLWFSWKYINGVNYWEESRDTGLPEGVTRWTPVSVQTQPDGGANVELELTYTNPSGRVDLAETRLLTISAPAADGSYTIDWRSTFKAGTAGALLDRTPMPGEPKGQVNGGYAGLGLPGAQAPLKVSFVSSNAPITELESSRARPAASAVAANFQSNGKAAGAIAIYSDPANSQGAAPWYLVNSAQPQMRFMCAAMLAPRPLKLAPGAQLKLHYKIDAASEAQSPGG